MSELHNMQPAHSANAARKPDTINWPLRILLLSGVGLLLGWLSVGLPQSTPLLLLRVLLQFKKLQAQIGMAALLGPLALLVVQSLLLLTAWGLFLWVIIREMRTFFSIQAAGQQPMPPIYPPAPLVYPPTQAAPSVSDLQTAPGIAPLAPSDQHNPFEQSASSLTPQQAATIYPPRPSSTPSLPEAPTLYIAPPAAPGNPSRPTGIASKQTRQASISQEQQQPETKEQDAPTMLIRQPEAEPEQKAQQQATEESDAERTILKSDVLAGLVAEMKASRQQPIEPIHAPIVDAQVVSPVEAGKSSAPSVEQQNALRPEVPPEKALISRSTVRGVRQSDHSKTANDPYAVQQDPYAVQADPLQLFSEEEENPLEPPAQQPEQPDFVFGNPFDGPLPDVFEHDEDLKRSLQQEQASPKGPKQPEQKK